MSSDLLLDTQIRSWVFLPIVLITFLIGILRHYIAKLSTIPRKADLPQIQETQIILKARQIRENAHYIPAESFAMRRHAFNKIDGLLTPTRPHQTRNIMTDPTFVSEMLRGNLTNVMPMIIIGGWINCFFSGFITTKIPFPLTLRFKSMLQREIELVQLDASWVSSASWYFLNVFGLQSIYLLVLGEEMEEDATNRMPDQMADFSCVNESKGAFKAEWEALEMVEHHWLLRDVERGWIGETIDREFYY